MLQTFSVVLSCLIGVFIVLQIRTLFFERNYLVGVSYLFIIFLMAAIEGVLAISTVSSIWGWLVFVVCLVVTVLSGGLFIAKINLRDNWGQPARRLLRTPTSLVPDFSPDQYDKFSVTTSDGVIISAYHIHTLPNKRLRHGAVIIAHGGFRSKDIFVKALMASWLSDEFDVIGFDFRGHGESGGYWTGDGKSVADLEAILKHTRDIMGYKKVGLFGRSMGGWTAVLEEADNHSLDALVVAGLPPGYFSEVPEFQGRIGILKYPLIPLLMRIVMGVRFRHFEDVRSPIKEIDRVAPTPLLILFNETDPGAGVVGTPGHWETIPENERPRSFRWIKSFPFTAQQVFDAAQQPKELYILPGAVHVYSLRSTRALFTQTELWFRKYLTQDS